MPKYRQLHLKILDSVDFNEMPDDFTRLVWVLMALAMDSEGRGNDNPAWLRSKIFPLREDVTLDQIEAVLAWLAGHNMILRYCVAGRKYFCIPTWKKYQTGTDKEATSTIPAPELLRSYSGVAPELLPANQPTNIQPINNQPTKETHNKENPENSAESPKDYKLVMKITKWMDIPKTDENLDYMRNVATIRVHHPQDIEEYLTPFWQAYDKRYPGSTRLAWVGWGLTGKIPPERKIHPAGNSPAKKRVLHDAYGNEVEE